MGGVEAGSKIFLGNVFRKGNRRSDPAVFLSLYFPPGLERPFYNPHGGTPELPEKNKPESLGMSSDKLLKII